MPKSIEVTYQVSGWSWPSLKPFTRTETVAVAKCIGTCPYFGIDGAPEPIYLCRHPKFEKCKPYENAIWEQRKDYTNRFPNRCPLMPWNKHEKPQR